MNPEILESVVADQLRSDEDTPLFSVGDTLNVHVRIIEGDKERIQVYQGVLIADRGRGINRMLTVRRIVANEGVERVFPIHSPRIAKIEVVRRGDARRSKLYYLRDRVGKSRRLRDQRRGLTHVKTWEDAQGGRSSKKAKPVEEPVVEETVAPAAEESAAE
jgi:large subunit ribosomal protein L19